MDLADVEERARQFFSAQKYVEAAKEYRRLAHAEPLCAKWLTNRAKCRFHRHKYAAALSLCRESIEVDHHWSRGYEVGAQCLLALRRNQEAEDLLLQGMDAAPSPVIKKFLNDARAAIREQSETDHFAEVLHANAPEGPLAKHWCSGMFFEPPIRTATEQAHARLVARRDQASKTTGHRPPATGQGVILGEDEREALRGLSRRELVLSTVESMEEGHLDIDEGIGLLTREAEGGCNAAMHQLARMYVNGHGVPADPEFGISWARRCIRSGADAYWRGLGLPDQDMARVEELLGSAYEDGVGGLDEDLVQAERWLRAAADKGLVAAINNLAIVCKKMGRPARDSTALFCRAAKAGSVLAMVSLGTRLMDGNGCARDLGKASRWLDKAARGGSVVAVKSLVKLSHQFAFEAVPMLETARRHVQSWRTHDMSAPCGVRGVTLTVEASLCLETQVARDVRKSADELFRELVAGGHTPPTLAEFLKGKPVTMYLGEDYKALLLERVQRRRKLTELERDAARLAEEAGKLVAASMAEPHAVAASLDFTTGLMFAVGRVFDWKGMEAEAHARFYRPAAMMGDAQSCHVAGRYLSKAAKSGRELRAARRFLSEAASRCEPGAQDDLDALMARLARGDLFPPLEDDDSDDDEAGDSGGDAGSSRGNAVGSAERGSDGGPTAEELGAAWDLLKLIYPRVDEHPLFVPGGPAVHIPMLEAYISSHTGSLSGWSLLYSMRHFQRALLAMVRGDYAAAVMDLSLAYMFDDNGVYIPSSVHDRMGELPALQALFDHVDAELAEGPSSDSSYSSSQGSASTSGRTNAAGAGASGQIQTSLSLSLTSSGSRYFQAAVVKMFTARNIRDRAQFADVALRAAPPRLVPVLQRWRGRFASEQRDPRAALADATIAGRLLHSDASTSLWPYDPPELVAASLPIPIPSSSPSPSPSPSSSPSPAPSPPSSESNEKSQSAASLGESTLGKLRGAMATTLEYDMAGYEAELGQTRASLERFQRFQKGVPKDTHGLPESYSNFFSALATHNVFEEVQMQSWHPLLEEAERAVHLRLPVFQPLSGKMLLPLQSLRMTLDLLACAGQPWPDDRDEPSVAEEKGSRDSPSDLGSEGLGPAGASTYSANQGGGGGAAKKACATCGAQATSLSQCGRCRLVHYCSRECQKKHWKEGHREACAQLAS
eukprot:jgi/Mesvir1/2305/Mv19338-RA.1